MVREAPLTSSIDPAIKSFAPGLVDLAYLWKLKRSFVQFDDTHTQIQSYISVTFTFSLIFCLRNEETPRADQSKRSKILLWSVSPHSDADLCWILFIRRQKKRQSSCLALEEGRAASSSSGFYGRFTALCLITASFWMKLVFEVKVIFNINKYSHTLFNVI